MVYSNCCFLTSGREVCGAARQGYVLPFREFTVNLIRPLLILEGVFQWYLSSIQFVHPLPRDEGYEFFYSQFSGHRCFFTSLINYQVLCCVVGWHGSWIEDQRVSTLKTLKWLVVKALDSALTASEPVNITSSSSITFLRHALNASLIDLDHHNIGVIISIPFFNSEYNCEQFQLLFPFSVL